MACGEVSVRVDKILITESKVQTLEIENGLEEAIFLESVNGENKKKLEPGGKFKISFTVSILSDVDHSKGVQKFNGLNVYRLKDSIENKFILNEKSEGNSLKYIKIEKPKNLRYRLKNNRSKKIRIKLDDCGKWYNKVKSNVFKIKINKINFEYKVNNSAVKVISLIENRTEYIQLCPESYTQLSLNFKFMKIP